MIKIDIKSLDQKRLISLLKRHQCSDALLHMLHYEYGISQRYLDRLVMEIRLNSKRKVKAARKPSPDHYCIRCGCILPRGNVTLWCEGCWDMGVRYTL